MPANIYPISWCEHGPKCRCLWATWENGNLVSCNRLWRGEPALDGEGSPFAAKSSSGEPAASRCPWRSPGPARQWEGSGSSRLGCSVRRKGKNSTFRPSSLWATWENHSRFRDNLSSAHHGYLYLQAGTVYCSWLGSQSQQGVSYRYSRFYWSWLK